MQYPKGTKFNNWVLFFEKQKGKSVPVIRRWIVFESGERHLERLSVKKYKSLRDNIYDLKQFVVRLNQEVPVEQRTIEKIEIRHAYISPALLDTYKEFLYAQIPSKDRANYEYNLMEKYFLGFFINTLGIPSPVQWHKIHKTEWANFLLSDAAPESSRSKKEIISASNRFILWLHDRRPEEVPPLKFNPISTAKFKEIEATREMNGESHKPQMIKDDDWKVIKLKAPKKLQPFMLMAYHYGLRRSETLGLQLTDIKIGHLSIERQLESIPDGNAKFAPLKGREIRKVPHWFGTPKDIYGWISFIVENRMHPDTLTTLWINLMTKLHMEYTFHDLRHTWITKAMRQQKVPRDVQLAAGHKNIQTTMGYLHDDRELEDEVFIPEGA